MSASDGEDQAEQAVDRRKKVAWHMSREVSVTNVITILSVLIALVAGWEKLSGRIEAVEKDQIRFETNAKLIETRLEQKLDRIQHVVDVIKEQFLRQAQNDLEREKRLNDDLRNRNSSRP